MKQTTHVEQTHTHMENNQRSQALENSYRDGTIDV